MGTVNKYRVFEITSNVPYLTKEKILFAIKSHKSIKQDCSVLHDKDRYTKAQVDRIIKRLYKDWSSAWDSEDERYEQMEYIRKSYKEDDKDKFLEDKTPEVDSLKAPHFHSYIVCNPPQSIKTIASWYDIAPQNVEVKKGAGAFVDCVEYAVHETESAKSEGKYPYPWEDLFSVNCSIDDLKESVNNKRIRRVRYGKDLNETEMLRMKVMEEGLSLREAIRDYPLLYSADESTLKRMRSVYLSHHQEPPMTRINFYLCGAGGIGKDLMSKAIARSLYPQLSDEECFYEVADMRVPFDNYDGQPIIIWSDKRAIDFIQTFGRGMTFKLFDLTPSRAPVNIKYGSISVLNAVNIVNGVDTYFDFLNGLAGEYTDKFGNEYKSEDKGQAYRRFPVIIPIEADAFSILLNSGWLDDNNNFTEYRTYKKVSGNLSRLMFDPRLKKLPPDRVKHMVKEFEQKMTGMFPEVVSLMQNGYFDKFSDAFEGLTDDIGAEADKLENELLSSIKVSDADSDESFIPCYSLKDICSLNVPSMLFGDSYPSSLKLANSQGDTVVLQAKYRGFTDGRPYCYIEPMGKYPSGYSADDTRPVWHIV